MTLRPDPYARPGERRDVRRPRGLRRGRGRRGVEPATLAVAWVLGNPQVTAVVVGPRRPEQLATAARGDRARAVGRRTRRAGRVVRVSELLVLGHDDVKRLLPMDECVELMETVLADLARGSVWQPLRFVVRPPDEPSLMGLMPAHRSEPDAVLRAEGGLHLPEQRGAGHRPAPGRRPALRRRDRRAARPRRRLGGDRDPHRRRLGRRDAPAGQEGRAAAGDPRLGRAGAVAPRGDGGCASLRGARVWSRTAGARERVRRRGAGAVPGRGGRDRGGRRCETPTSS